MLGESLVVLAIGSRNFDSTRSDLSFLAANGAGNLRPTESIYESTEF